MENAVEEAPLCCGRTRAGLVPGDLLLIFAAAEVVSGLHNRDFRDVVRRKASFALAQS